MIRLQPDRGQSRICVSRTVPLARSRRCRAILRIVRRSFGQQRQSCLSQLRILGHHEHVGEKSIDGLAERAELAHRIAVALLRQSRFDRRPTRFASRPAARSRPARRSLARNPSSRAPSKSFVMFLTRLEQDGERLELGRLSRLRQRLEPAGAHSAAVSTSAARPLVFHRGGILVSPAGVSRGR